MNKFTILLSELIKNTRSYLESDDDDEDLTKIPKQIYSFYPPSSSTQIFQGVKLTAVNL